MASQEGGTFCLSADIYLIIINKVLSLKVELFQVTMASHTKTMDLYWVKQMLI